MGETEKMTQISGRPSYRPFVPCGSYANQKVADAAARALTIGGQWWRVVQVERRSEGRKHAIQRMA